MPTRDYITVVSGLPRSGTSLLMRMLEAGGIPPLVDGLRRADPDNPRGYYEFEPVKRTRADASWVPQAVGRVVKMVHVLLRDLPLSHPYRIVFMRRDLDEVVASQNAMLARTCKPTDALPAETIKEVYRAQVAAAIEYVAARAANFTLVEVDYNELLREPAPHLARLSAALDGLDTESMARVIEPQLYRQRSGH